MIEEKVKDYKGLTRVDKTFIVNNDDAAYQTALARRQKILNQQTLESRVDKIEENISEILRLLRKG